MFTSSVPHVTICYVVTEGSEEEAPVCISLISL